MKIAIKDGDLLIQQVTSDQYNIIKSWNAMRWVRSEQILRGRVSMALLDRLTVFGRLPPHIEAVRQQMHRKQEAVNKERTNQIPMPLIAPPVKVNLFEHQKRALNMCLLTFEWAEPEGGDSDAGAC